jgi:hypothetical protein
MAYWIHSAPADADGDGQRPCARGERCASRDAGKNPLLGPRTFCAADRAHIATCLGWLPEAYVELYLRLAEKGSGGHDKVSGSRDHSVPPNLGVDALMVEIIHLVASWDDRVRAVANLSEPGRRVSSRRMDAGVPLSRMVATLSAHLDAALALEPEPMMRYIPISQAADLPPGTIGWVRPAADYAEVMLDLSGAEFGLEILTVHRKIRHLLGLTPKHQDLPVPCWSCGVKAVRRWDGGAGLADEAECGECGETYTNERYGLLMAEVARRQQAKTRKAAS